MNSYSCAQHDIHTCSVIGIASGLLMRFHSGREQNRFLSTLPGKSAIVIRNPSHLPLKGTRR